VANPSFGFLISETGAGYTWAGNSQANRLTPWNNDPVTDPPGEVVYLRDETTGEYWTPTPLPRTDEGGKMRDEKEATAVLSFSVRHGQGYTIFEDNSHGVDQELLLFVPLTAEKEGVSGQGSEVRRDNVARPAGAVSYDPWPLTADPYSSVKFVRLRVRNTESRPRRLSATFYAEWVLGTVRDQAATQVVTWIDATTGALLARNPFNMDFGSRVAFVDVNLRPRTFTSDRTEFLGRNGSVADPAALGRIGLSGRVEPGVDPCAAIMTSVSLEPGQEKEVIFYLGQADSPEEVQQILRLYKDASRVQEAYDAVRHEWEQTLTAVQVRTPDPAFDLMINRWLLYQVLSCRVWGRSAFYQSGGAYGFRDQLQDVMALVYSLPDEERGQILRAASRQFLEGDVQHWWHPPAGRGVRTRFSDDFLWLPFVTCHYVTSTGDQTILDERLPFLRAPVLRPEQEEDYGLPETTEEKATLYEHCVRAVEHGLRFGAHGLPLMGTGDWNDGMNRVGAQGKGESVWNGWFLLSILHSFARLSERRGDSDRALRYRGQAEQLRQAQEMQAWDGAWYRRAYFDDGTPLGSAQNDECKIDSIAQSWAVISQAAEHARARQAMDSATEHLVRHSDKLILLFTPAFDRGSLEPGYIKGYVPGIRENGGQYTHAATWMVLASALLHQGNRAAQLFQMLNPISHTLSPEDLSRYRVEPYVVAADVYSEPPHTGRGGWTWYTGSAGWLYRVGLENMLGFHREGSKLRIEPCISSSWPRYEITYRYYSSTYHITVHNPRGVEHGVERVTADGSVPTDKLIELVDDGRRHEVEVVLGRQESEQKT
jgi:cyclic beta-1,2-glucan synthetase